MTRGNQRETDRARAQARTAKNGNLGKSNLDANLKALSIMCEICRQTFMGTSSETVLRQHQESKHPKQTTKECFPSQSWA